jgi:hypothetical protein
MRPGCQPINAARAIELYAGGRRTWDEVGRLLASEEGRPVSYGGVATQRAARRLDLAAPGVHPKAPLT